MEVSQLDFWSIIYFSQLYNLYAHRNFAIVIAMMIAFGAAHLLASEYIPAQSSRGEVLLFRSKGASREAADTRSSATPTATSREVRRDPLPAASDYSLATLSRQPTVFHWRNLNYEIKTRGNSRKILQDIHGWIKPGTLTALMVSKV